MSTSVWSQLNTWLWDGNRKSPVPSILTKPGSPVTHRNLLTMFMNNGPLNKYLNTYLNTYHVFSIDKEEFLIFIKRCVIDYKVRKGSSFYTRRPSKDKLYDILREKIVSLKNDDVLLLSEMISRSKDREQIYETLGLEVPKVKKTKKKKPKKISFKAYISENFSMVDI